MSKIIYGTQGNLTTNVDSPTTSFNLGYLYNWYAVNSGYVLSPMDFHIPSDGEWTDLQNLLISVGYSGIEGKTLKTTDVEWFLSANNTNTFSFSSDPGGLRWTDGGFYLGRGSGFWWSSSERSTALSYFRSMSFNLNSIIRSGNYFKNIGMSIRCVRDTITNVQDIDNNYYTTIVIGAQEWLQTNYIAEKYSDGSPMLYVSTGLTYVNIITSTSWTNSSMSDPPNDYINGGYITFSTYLLGISSAIGQTQPISPRFSSCYLLTNESLYSPYQIDGSFDITISGTGPWLTISYETSPGVDYIILSQQVVNGFNSFSVTTDDKYGVLPNRDNLPKIFKIRLWNTDGTIVEGAAASGYIESNWVSINTYDVSFTFLMNLVITAHYGWPLGDYPAYCYYDNNPSNKINYGNLYNWNAVTDNLFVYIKRNGTQETGWRVPTYTDYNNLDNYLGGSSVAGGKLASNGWTTTYGGYRNKQYSQFAGPPNYWFNGIDDHGLWWTDTFGSSNPKYKDYHLGTSDFPFNENIDGYAGMSVRLVRDISDIKMIDPDGNYYDTVKIGNQIWTTSNLKTTKYRNANIVKITNNASWIADTAGAYCSYNNDDTNV